jgi:hypothetical protein
MQSAKHRNAEIASARETHEGCPRKAALRPRSALVYVNPDEPAGLHAKASKGSSGSPGSVQLASRRWKLLIVPVTLLVCDRDAVQPGTRQADAASMVVAWRTATNTRWSSSARA